MGDQKAGDAEAQPEDGRQETGVREPLMDDSQLEILTSHHRLEEGHPEYTGGKLTLDILPKEFDLSSCSDVSSTRDLAERGSWGGKMEFIFTCIGYAVGLGNVWRFPYLCYKNGGGAFLVPYIIMLAGVGLPLFFMELAFGQFASLGPIAIWKINPLFKGVGYAVVAISWMIAVYYNVIISHVMFYLFASFASIGKGYLPWITCNNPWNTPKCISPIYVGGPANGTANISEAFTNHTDVLLNGTDSATATIAHAYNGSDMATPAEEYYNYFVMDISEGMEDSWVINWRLALCLLLAWLIVLICLIRGIQSLGKVVYFTAIFPYLMLTILLIRGATLPGAIKGVEYYLKPDFSRLADARVWADAATQIFYSLSACCGGLIAMSSYNKFSNNCLRDSLIVSIINCFTSIYAGFVIFCVLGFMAVEKGVEVSEVAKGGPGLAFIVYPEALSRMPVPQMWAIFFFFMMATLGFGSQFSLVECVLSAITDEFPQYLRRSGPSYIFRTSVIIFTFLLGLPMVTRSGIYLLNLIDYSVSGFPLLVVGFLECISINWIYGIRNFSEDIEMMIGRKPNVYWRVCWTAITPSIVAALIVFNCIYYKPPDLDGYLYPAWAQAIGWMVAVFPVALVVVVFVWRYCRGGGLQLLRELSGPSTDWGPAMPENREGKYRTANGDSTEPLTPSKIDIGEKNFAFGTKNNIYKPKLGSNSSVELATYRSPSTPSLRDAGSLSRSASKELKPHVV